MQNANNWKNFNNPRLPPSVGPVWTYGSDSWSWVPKSDKSIPPNSNQLEYYWKWLQSQKGVPYPYNSVTLEGGMSSNTARYLSDSIYNNVPDLRSETVEMKKQIDEYVNALKQHNLLPADIHRNKI